MCAWRVCVEIGFCVATVFDSFLSRRKIGVMVVAS